MAGEKWSADGECLADVSPMGINCGVATNRRKEHEVTFDDDVARVSPSEDIEEAISKNYTARNAQKRLANTLVTSTS